VAPEIWTAGISGFSAQQRHDAASEEMTMPKRPGRNHSPAFKTKVAVVAIKGEKRLIELAQDIDVHPDQIQQWRDQLLEGATGYCQVWTVPV
jgi:transposase